MNNISNNRTVVAPAGQDSKYSKADDHAGEQVSTGSETNVRAKSSVDGRKPILSARDIEVQFSLRGDLLTAIRGCSLNLYEGETLAIVGESGAGKSVFTKCFVGMLDKNGKISKGSIEFEGEDLARLDYNSKRWLNIRGKKIGMVMQDPMTSLNPLMSVGKQIEESIRLHQGKHGLAAKQECLRLLRTVGINDVERRYRQLPHELSGGMRQRVVIAIAIAAQPQILICDEPTTALDVTIQAQILELIRDLQKQMNMTILYITHDLGVVAHVADRICVMYAGQIIEEGLADEIFYNSWHPYTWALMGAMPQLAQKNQLLPSIDGTPPNLFNKINGDAFAPRNKQALKIDFLAEAPVWSLSPTHKVRSWQLDPRAPEIYQPEHVRNLTSLIRRQLSPSQALDTETEGCEKAEVKAQMNKPAQSHEDPCKKEPRHLTEPANDPSITQIIVSEKAKAIANAGAARADLPVSDRKKEVLFDLKNVQIAFGKGKKKFVAVDQINFQIYRGETFALVGESGSGKTTIGRALVRINPLSQGEIKFKGQRISGKISKELDLELIRSCQMIFQDPMSSLNERAKVDYIVSEGLLNHHMYKDEAERREKVAKALRDVGLLPEFASRFPHEFSGGQRQRIGIARALIMEPEFIVADEPISALDVSIRAQVLNLMNNLRAKYGLTYLFIAHDLSVIRFISDRVAVIHRGRIVELAETEELFNHPLHPYTQALISAVPLPDPKLEKEKKLLTYQPKVHAQEQELSWQELRPGHFVLASEKEAVNWLKTDL